MGGVQKGAANLTSMYFGDTLSARIETVRVRTLAKNITA